MGLLVAVLGVPGVGSEAAAKRFSVSSEAAEAAAAAAEDEVELSFLLRMDFFLGPAEVTVDLFFNGCMSKVSSVDELRLRLPLPGTGFSTL